MEKQKINIVRKMGQNRSYYVDANGLLKGEWGGYHEDDDLINSKRIFRIFYSKFSKSIPIDENGFFYSKFSCIKYDGVLQLTDFLFLCEKENRYGVIDNKGNIILHTAFRKISYVPREFQNTSFDLFIVESETGVFLFNYTNKTESKEYCAITGYSNEYFLFEEDGKFGLLDNCGAVFVKAIYNKSIYLDDFKYFLYTELLGFRFRIFFENNKFYGKIPIDKYENCVYIEDGVRTLDGFYITYKNNKYGLLNNFGKTIVDPCLDEVYLYDGTIKPYTKIHFFNVGFGKYINIIYIIVKKNNKYALYDIISGECKIEECEEMEFVFGPRQRLSKTFDFIKFKKNDEIGYVTAGGFILDKQHFDMFTLDANYWIISKNGKCGVLNMTGFEYIPCIYDDIKHISTGLFLVHENGVEKKVGKDYEEYEDSLYDSRPYYSQREMMEDTWDAMTDGQYGDMPDDFDGDFDFLGY